LIRQGISVKNNFRSHGNGTIPQYITYIYIICNIITLTLAFFFTFSDTLSWDRMSGLLLAGTLSLAIGVFIHHTATATFRQALLFLLIILIFTTVDELMSIRWGIPFGQFYYNHHLKPMIPGGLPLFIPFAWYVLAYTPLVFLRRFAATIAQSSGKFFTLIIAAACALFLTSIDLLIEPVATALEAWTWLESGWYFNIPSSNFIGWFLLGSVMYFCYFNLNKNILIESEIKSFRIDSLLVLFSFLLTVLLNVTIIVQFKYLTPLLITLFLLAPFYGYWLLTHQRLRSVR